MRASLFLSTLFAVTTLGGAALAEKPIPQSEPRVVETARAHGDTVDKVYRAPGGDTGARGGARGDASGSAGGSAHKPQTPQTRALVDRAAQRINCPDTDTACGKAAHGEGREGGSGAGAGQGARQGRIPAFLDKFLGNDRTNFNEAGEDEGMSVRAANRLWARAGAQNQGEKMPVAGQRPVDRKEHPDKTARMSCDEGEECSMSSKAAKAEWAYAAVRAGTWRGPERAQPSNAERRINAYRAAEGSAHKHAGQQGGHEGGGGAAAPEGDH